MQQRKGTPFKDIGNRQQDERDRGRERQQSTVTETEEGTVATDIARQRQSITGRQR